MEHITEIHAIISNASKRDQSQLEKVINNLPFKLNAAYIDHESDLNTAIQHLTDLIFLFEDLDDPDGLNWLERLRAQFHYIPVILIARKGDQRTAITAMKAGVDDYIFKRELKPEVVERSIQYCLEKTAHHKEIEEQNSILQTFFQHTSDAVFITDRNWNLKSFNSKFDQTFLNDSKAIGKDIRKIFKHDKLGKLIHDFDEKEEDLDEELSLNVSGIDRQYRVRFTRIPIEDGSFSIIGSLLDITLSKRAETERREIEKVQLTHRMARILAHEVRNPLTNIHLSIDHLQEEMAGNDDHDLYLDIIQRNVKRIDKLIDTLLQSSKPFELDAKPTIVREVLDHAFANIKDRVELLNVEFIQHFPEKDTQWMLDPEKLELALVNLMTNALEALAEVETPKLMLMGLVKDDELVIQVKDNGKGMEEEVKDQLFDAFFTARKGGMGLGMTTVKAIVNAHKGSISLFSKPGEGTTFELRFPKQKDSLK